MISDRGLLVTVFLFSERRFLRLHQAKSTFRGLHVYQKNMNGEYKIGMDELKEYFAKGKTICLLGSSGAGKSTLINALTGEETMKTSEIRSYDSTGRHTTTHRQLIELERCCKFIDCKHETEPGCAIKAAIESGELSMERYMLYKNLGAENTRNYAKKKEISKWRNVHKQFDKRNRWD